MHIHRARTREQIRDERLLIEVHVHCHRDRPIARNAHICVLT